MPIETIVSMIQATTYSHLNDHLARNVAFDAIVYVLHVEILRRHRHHHPLGRHFHHLSTHLTSNHRRFYVLNVAIVRLDH